MGAPLKLAALLALIALATGGPNAAADDNFCGGCKAFVSFARQFNTSSDRSEYKELFESYCELFYPPSTDFQQGPCPLFPEALSYLLDHIDPIHHCDQIGACDPVRGPVSQPSDDIYDYMKISNYARPPISRADNVVCEFCEQIVRQVKESLSNPKVINQIKLQLEGFCSYLAIVDMDQECRQYLDKYIDQAIEFIKSMDPKRYCQSVSLCSAAMEASTRWRFKEATSESQLAQLPSLADFQNFGIETSVQVGERPKKVTSDTERKLTPSRAQKPVVPECALCKTVIKELFEFLRENKTEANIIQALEKVCSLVYMPGVKRNQCDSMVKAYTREIVQLMIDETDPEMICMLLGMCVYGTNDEASPVISKTLLPTRARKPAIKSNFGLADLITALGTNVGYKSPEACLECKVFIKFLKQEIEEPRTQEQIKNWLLKNLCQHLPEQDLVDSCSNVIEQNSAIFFKALENLLTPTQACRELGVCNTRNVASVFNLEGSSLEPGLRFLPMVFSAQRARSSSETAKRISQMPTEFRGQMCEQCVEIVSEIDEYLSSHPIDQDVSQIIDRVCNKLPEGSARTECTYIIKTFGAEIVQAISTMDNPRQLCSKIYLCQAN